jgi:hypothetical protein
VLVARKKLQALQEKDRSLVGQIEGIKKRFIQG